MNRRTFVTSLGATVAASVVSGCAGQPGTGISTRDEDSTIEVGESVTVGDRRVRVAETRLAEAVFLDHDRFLSVERRDGWQFVLADASVEGGGVPLADFAFGLVVDGETHRAGFEPTAVSETGIAPDGDGSVGLPVPVAPASSAGLAVGLDGESATWRLDSDLLEGFDRVPAFAVREARIEPTDDGIGIHLAVENEGDRDGTFRALAAPADVADVDYPVAFDVPAGETVVHGRPLDEREDSGSVRIVSEWSVDSRRFEYG